MLDMDSKIYVAGHRGLVGSALVRRLRAGGFGNLLLKTHAELDLCNQASVRAFFEEQKPEYVFLAAAKVGGILANDTYPADFIRDNLLIQSNVIDAAYESGVKKLLFLGSSCIYPKYAPQPICEDALLTSDLEPTNEWYAIAKIAGLKMCVAYKRQYGFNAVSVMPTNIYGPGDNYDFKTSHVVPALLRRFHEAKKANEPSVVVWGTGTVRREFLHVDDLADGCLYVMRHYDGEQWLNIGTGSDVTIQELAETVKDVVEYSGAIEYDSSKPDGTPRKLLDVGRLSTLGWQAKIKLRDGLERTYIDFKENLDNF